MASGTTKPTVKGKQKAEKSGTSKAPPKPRPRHKKIDVTGKPRGVGQPSTYKPEYCQMLIDHMAEGYNFTTFAAKLNYTSNRILYDWVALHPEFAEAKKIGEAKSEYWWVGLARAAAAGKVPKFNSTAWIFCMKNMFKWADKHEIKAEVRELREVVHQVEIGLDGDISQHRLEIPIGEERNAAKD